VATLSKGQVLHETYRVRKLLARGGMGEVYEAEHVRLANKRLAIKVLHEAVVEDPTACTRFVMEAEIVSGLGHPHIVSVTDFNELASGQPYMVMEYLEGEELSARLKRDGRLPPAHVALLLEQTADALSRVHEQGIVHRDLKPGNIFLVDTSANAIHIKLLDFGISKIKASHMQLTQMKTVLGTPHFMSPEQAKGAIEEIDRATDIFSLGAIAYVCLTARMPFAAEKLVDLVTEISTTTPPAPSDLIPGLPPALDQVIARAMAKEPSERYEKVLELAAAFREALGQGGGGARSEDEEWSEVSLPNPMTVSNMPDAGADEAPPARSTPPPAAPAPAPAPATPPPAAVLDQATAMVAGEEVTEDRPAGQALDLMEQATVMVQGEDPDEPAPPPATPRATTAYSEEDLDPSTVNYHTAGEAGAAEEADNLATRELDFKATRVMQSRGRRADDAVTAPYSAVDEKREAAGEALEDLPTVTADRFEAADTAESDAGGLENADTAEKDAGELEDADNAEAAAVGFDEADTAKSGAGGLEGADTGEGAGVGFEDAETAESDVRSQKGADSDEGAAGGLEDLPTRAASPKPAKAPQAPPPPVAATPVARRSRAWLAVVGVVALLVIGGFLWGLLAPGDGAGPPVRAAAAPPPPDAGAALPPDASPRPPPDTLAPAAAPDRALPADAATPDRAIQTDTAPPAPDRAAAASPDKQVRRKRRRPRRRPRKKKLQPFREL